MGKKLMPVFRSNNDNFSKRNMMNKLIYMLVFPLAITSLNTVAYAPEIIDDVVANDIHSEAHPNNARIRSADHHFEVYIRGFDLSELLIEFWKNGSNQSRNSTWSSRNQDLSLVYSAN
jgi:hypothetical protein